jgi:hypothetical protein
VIEVVPAVKLELSDALVPPEPPQPDKQFTLALTTEAPVGAVPQTVTPDAEPAIWVMFPATALWFEAMTTGEEFAIVAWPFELTLVTSAFRAGTAMALGAVP